MRTFTRQSGSDDSAALQAFLDAGPGVAHLPAGEYRAAGLRIPAGVTLRGEGPATVIRSAGGSVFEQRRVGDWGLCDLVLDGDAPDTEAWQQRLDTNQHGVVAEKSYGFRITDVTVQNFRGAGLQLTHTALGDNAPFSNGGSLHNITARRNFIGVRFDTRGEYINATQLDCHHNLTGVVIHAGNVKIVASNLCSNRDGVFIEDHKNGSHGLISGSMINHNERMAVHCRKAANGMAITGCCLYYGDITLEDSAGITFANCHLYAGIRVSGAGVNRFSGNYIVKSPYSHDLGPRTLAQHNYTQDGPWELNRRPERS
jgi:hypothetical protein